MTRQTYFEHPVLERDLGDDFLQLVVLAAQILDFVAGGFANRVASKLFLPGFEKVLASSVGQAGGEPFSAAQVCNALRASKRFEPASSRGSRGLASAAARRSTFPHRAPSSRKHVGSNEMRRGELEPSPASSPQRALKRHQERAKFCSSQGTPIAVRKMVLGSDRRPSRDCGAVEVLRTVILGIKPYEFHSPSFSFSSSSGVVGAAPVASLRSTCMGLFLFVVFPGSA